MLLLKYCVYMNNIIRENIYKYSNFSDFDENAVTIRRVRERELIK